MAATTTAFSNLLKQLRTDYPTLSFISSDSFRWSAQEKVVYFGEPSATNIPLLLHEASHGILDHDGYGYDLQLIQLEREAWSKATEMGKMYGYSIESENIEDALDTYREWLHERSTCPNCARNGIQTAEDTYECLACHQKWRVNEARTCGLKRTRV